jgi:hypothetical protein
MMFPLPSFDIFIEDPVGSYVVRDQKGNADVTFTYLLHRTSINLPVRDSGLLIGRSLTWFPEALGSERV